MINDSMTQGSVVSELRSDKYNDCHCYGIIISARCDIANNKIQKIYYLEAIDLESWLFSKIGFDLLIKGEINILNDRLQTICKEYGLDWDTLKHFDFDEFEKVANQEITKKVKKTKALEDYKLYKKYINPCTSHEERKEILSSKASTITNFMSEIFSGRNTHLAYIPESGFKDPIENGLIVDLQELDYLNLETAIDLTNCLIDSQNTELEKEKKEYYNTKFILDDFPGYSMISGEIVSPWIEYLMQRFSNMFTRIGVDFPSKSEFKTIIEKILEEVK